MIGEPMSDPRAAIISDLEKSKEAFLAAGKTIQNIPSGHSGFLSEGPVTGHQKVQRAERAKLAPALRELAESGRSLRAAANALKLKVDRAQLIAKENNIMFNRV
ncbi:MULTISPECIES: hypothetical protein [Pseudomonas]|uniref:hypothetical protein n=1 Tax=Pseudomonas TaxID=286 RepID=UPI000B3619C4|nr:MULTISPECIES: hypothetical protein [Pseudomonas]PMY32841.1 hypothetical protein C1Y35_27300 [Pseudomonas sp. GW456-L14]PMY57048.1 hypothetical protein C1Y34_11260 [Pseudomonas sp. GW456-L12]PMY68984.1 hypothetical protein C1Y31_06320 [Pseudomonas sp. FW305-25]PMY74619.1 hypothetical protein C1Y32_05045 [Pseudomonas sp. FW126-L8]PNA82943.1 hypothetical protein C1Y33_02540 [Pseudomonas sp. FW305-76]